MFETTTRYYPEKDALGWATHVIKVEGKVFGPGMRLVCTLAGGAIGYGIYHLGPGKWRWYVGVIAYGTGSVMALFASTCYYRELSRVQESVDLDSQLKSLSTTREMAKIPAGLKAWVGRDPKNKAAKLLPQRYKQWCDFPAGTMPVDVSQTPFTVVQEAYRGILHEFKTIAEAVNDVQFKLGIGMLIAREEAFPEEPAELRSSTYYPLGEHWTTAATKTTWAEFSSVLRSPSG
jgi:hypothetical protein